MHGFDRQGLVTDLILNDDFSKGSELSVREFCLALLCTVGDSHIIHQRAHLLTDKCMHYTTAFLSVHRPHRQKDPLDHVA